MNENEFYEGITVKKDDRYALIFFILNTLNFIQGGDYYCYCEKIIKKENDIASRPRWRSGPCQICRIPCIFDFEQDIDKNRFNMMVLCRYYDQLYSELVKLFDQCPKAAECFLGGEYVYGGRGWNSGEYWHVPLSQSIWYADGIRLAQERNKEKEKELGPFPPEKK